MTVWHCFCTYLLRFLFVRNSSTFSALPARVLRDGVSVVTSRRMAAGSVVAVAGGSVEVVVQWL